MMVADQDEIKAIVAAIQKFKQRSAHGNVQNMAELQTVLSKSSVNPEINPGAREGVETILRGKQTTQEDAPLEELMAGDGLLQAAGFSSLSVSRHNNRTQAAKFEKELQKELEEIKADARRRRALDYPEPIVYQTRAALPIHARNPVDIPEDADMKYERDDDDDEDEKETQDTNGMNVLVPGFGAQMIRPGVAFNVQGLHPGRKPDPVLAVTPPTAPVVDRTKAELAAARKMISMGYPARAALARGIAPRHGGMTGNAIRKTAMGLSDAF
jgi:hypothetical protein